jgi:tagatose 6-phosphate kinase
MKPNAAELADLTGLPVTSVSSAVAAARVAVDRGAREVIISLGPLGLVACADGSEWHAGPPEIVAPNPTGAGDALVAALAAGRLAGLDRPALLAQAVAWSAAAAAHPVAGEIDVAIADQVRPLVRVVSAPPEPDLDRTGSL